MTSPTSRSIRCPACQTAIEFELFESINVQLDEGAREQLFESRINRAECPGCGMVHQVSAPLLWHDVERRHWFQIIGGPDKEPAHEQHVRTYFNEIGRLERNGLQGVTDAVSHYTIRLLYSMDELVEQVAMLEDGFDDHVVRVMKWMGRGKVGKCPDCGADEQMPFYIPRRWLPERVTAAARRLVFQSICRRCSNEREWSIQSGLYEELRPPIREVLDQVAPGDAFISGLLCRQIAQELSDQGAMG